jgi:hypothetical protein
MGRPRPPRGCRAIERRRRRYITLQTQWFFYSPAVNIIISLTIGKFNYWALCNFTKQKYDTQYNASPYYLKIVFPIELNFPDIIFHTTF